MRLPFAAVLAAAALTGASALASAAGASSASMQFCDKPGATTALQQDHVLRFAAIVRRELEASGASVALISRNGTDLRRFGLRYSHSGLSLKVNANGAWSVRQLYYACDERRPRLFDQGIAGFLLGTDEPTLGFISIVLLPDTPAATLERAALDNARALQLLAARYSANAFPFSTEYQNCNQWIAEMLAVAWAPLNDDAAALRPRAQEWLAAQGYAPTTVEVGSHWLMAVAPFVPLIHVDDHPLDDQFALHFRISLPTALEQFVRTQAPTAKRIELCHDDHHAVVHYGWDPVAEDCTPRDGDQVVEFD